MNRERQASESLQLGLLLAVSGGFMDAYSYMCRGHVFANAQTGNLLLCGIHLSQGEGQVALKYLFPVLAFLIGIALADVVRFYFRELRIPHWRQLTILFEALVLCIVSLLSQSSNLLANSITSFACGIQVESFRKIKGTGIATTMCIGNLRSGTQYLCEYFHTREKTALQKGCLYFTVIEFFVIGAVLGNLAVNLIREKAILVSALFLLIGFVLMFCGSATCHKRKKGRD